MPDDEGRQQAQPAAAVLVRGTAARRSATRAHAGLKGDCPYTSGELRCVADQELTNGRDGRVPTGIDECVPLTDGTDALGSTVQWHEMQLSGMSPGFWPG